MIAEDIAGPEADQPLVMHNTELNESILETLDGAGINEFRVLAIDGVNYSESFRKTLALDKVISTEDALLEIYRRLASLESSNS